MKYRRKPVIVEAVRWTGQPLNSLPEWFNKRAEYTHVTKNVLYYTQIGYGLRHVEMDSWIALESGELVPRIPDDFAAAYEAITDNPRKTGE